MLRKLAITLALAAALAAAAVPALPTATAEGKTCRSVGSYTVVAQRMSCRYAQRYVRRWARTNRTPRRWSCVKRRGKSVSCSRGNRAFGAYRKPRR